VVEVQRDVQRQKQLERAQKDVQRVLQTASESENKLDVALKVRYFFLWMLRNIPPFSVVQL